MVRFLISTVFSGAVFIRGRRLVLKRGRHLIEARHLLGEIRYFWTDSSKRSKVTTEYVKNACSVEITLYLEKVTTKIDRSVLQLGQICKLAALPPLIKRTFFFHERT